MATLRAKTARRKSSSVSRRHEAERRRRSSTVAEVVGGTTAGFAAIACCAPYGVANLLVLVVYKVPAGLCRKAFRERRRRRLLKSGLMPMRSNSADGGDLAELYAAQAVFRWSGEEVVEVEIITEEEFMDLEKEMWDHFSSAGFWRSASRKQA